MDMPNYVPGSYGVDCDMPLIAPPSDLKWDSSEIYAGGITWVDGTDWKDLAMRLTTENDALVAENAALKAHVALLTGKPVELSQGEVLERALSAGSFWTGA